MNEYRFVFVKKKKRTIGLIHLRC